MSEKKWVQHISGQGEKWELCDMGAGKAYNDNENCANWQVYAKSTRGINYHYLPKSEYIECPPPERWENVTGECKVGTAVPEGKRGTILHKNDDSGYTDILNPCQLNNYHLRKVYLWDNIESTSQWAFIIERKVSS